MRDGTRQKLVDATRSHYSLRTPDGRRIVRFEFDDRFRWARLDPDTLALTWVGGVARDHDRAKFYAVAAANDSMIGILNKKQIVRVHFGRDEHEVLFPR